MDAVLEAHRDVCVIDVSLRVSLVFWRSTWAYAHLTILSILGGGKV
jgi:hypothetical protein